MQGFNSDLFLTTSEVGELLDVHPSTVKRWSDGGELRTKKTDGGHRRIYLRDVMDFARHRQVSTYLSPFTPFESHVWLAVRDAVRNDDFERVVSLSMGWLVRGYPRRITALLRELGSRSDVSLARLCDAALQPFMAQVGAAWREGRLRIGEEHMATQAAMEALVCLSQGSGPGATLTPSRNGDGSHRVAVVGAMEGDHHHLGAMCARVLLERAGWTVFYLGADTPAEEFAAIQRAHAADLVCVSFSPPGSAAHMRRCLDVLREFYRPHLPYDLVFGGVNSETFDPDRVPAPFRSFEILPSMEAFVEWGRNRPEGQGGDLWRKLG